MKSKDEQPWRELGLTGEEYERIKRELGREPNLVELNMYSVMWSEHCSYKHSRAALRRLPATGPRVLQGPGENAGVVDRGGGLAASLKIESHNQPTAVEPFQGAATGRGLSATSWPWGAPGGPARLAALRAAGRWAQPLPLRAGGCRNGLVCQGDGDSRGRGRYLL